MSKTKLTADEWRERVEQNEQRLLNATPQQKIEWVQQDLERLRAAMLFYASQQRTEDQWLRIKGNQMPVLGRMRALLPGLASALEGRVSQPAELKHRTAVLVGYLFREWLPTLTAVSLGDEEKATIDRLHDELERVAEQWRHITKPDDLLKPLQAAGLYESLTGDSCSPDTIIRRKNEGLLTDYDGKVSKAEVRKNLSLIKQRTTK